MINHAAFKLCRVKSNLKRKLNSGGIFGFKKVLNPRNNLLFLQALSYP